jgi:putative transposase
MVLAERSRQIRFLIRDRDTKFAASFDAAFTVDGVRVIRMPVRSPNANAIAERWIRTLRQECRDRMLIFSRRELEHVLRVYVNPYNEHRPHRASSCARPNRRVPSPRSITPRPATSAGAIASAVSYTSTTGPEARDKRGF